MATAPITGIHVWDEHDTWWSIAARYTGNGLNWVALAHANPQVTNPNKVPLGTRINIPGELAE